MAVATTTTMSDPAPLQSTPTRTNENPKATLEDHEREPVVSNEYVLNVAFLSFFLFTAVQFVFAFLAKSQSMLADCAAMSVDVISYFVNFLAERLKHGHSAMTPQQLKLKRLYLELIPPLISVVTLVVVTIMALQLAIQSLADAYRGKASSTVPDVKLMLLFSFLNGILDFVNVTCFARADQAVGLPGQHGNEDVHVHFDHHSHSNHQEGVVSETTPLVGGSNPQNQTNNPNPNANLLGLQQEESGGDNDDSSSALSSEVERQGMNLNMCSAWTHICADTLRSITVLMAAGVSYLFPDLLTPVEADSWGAIVVSIIILASLAPLIQGLYFTAQKIQVIWEENRRTQSHFKHVVINV